MQSIDDRGPPPPCPAPFNLAAHVLAPAAETPDKIALAVLGPSRAERWSYARLAGAVAGVAGALAAQHDPGARVLLRLGNSVAFPVAFLGAISAGLIPAPVSAQLTAPEIAALLPGLAPARIIADPALPLPETGIPVTPAGEIAGWQGHAPLAPIPGDPDRPGYIVYTSGTSGAARGVIHAHRAVWARGMMRAGWYGLTAEDRVLHAGALNWTYTLGTGLLDPWAAGATALIPEPGVAPRRLPLLLRRHEATLFAAAPGLYRQMLAAGARLDLPKLRHGLSAGEKLPEATRAAWEAATGRPIFEAFGMSECSTFLSASPARPAPPGTLGYAQPGRTLAILGPDGAPVPRGEAGTIAVARSDPGLMLGYLGHAKETAARYTGAWFLTGDLGEMAGDGAITYLGRADDMMNAGGLRVSPLEVEAVLLRFPGLAEAAATEVTVKANTTVIAAFYRADGALDEAALSAHISAHLARYKQPRLLIPVDALPRSANGKLRRKALRSAYEAEHGAP